MAASEDGSLLVALEATDASAFRTNALGTKRREPDRMFASTPRVWLEIHRTLSFMRDQSLNTWTALGQEVSALRGCDDRHPRVIGINRVDIAAVRADSHKRARADNAERTDPPNVRCAAKSPHIFL